MVVGEVRELGERGAKKNAKVIKQEVIKKCRGKHNQNQVK